VLATQAGKLTLALRYPDDKQAPDPALFTSPGRVLSARADLSATQSAQLKLAENSAYGGVDSLSLVGQTLSDAARAQPPLPGGSLGDGLPVATPRIARSQGSASSVSDGFVEVIRGGEIKREASDSRMIPGAAMSSAGAGAGGGP